MGKRAEEIRSMFRKADDARYKDAKVPEHICRYTDLAYGKHSQQVLDVYLPEDEQESYPVVVSVHGGGWVYGDKDLYQWYSMSLVRFGYAVVNFSYRLAPETKFPAQLEDTGSVLNWIKEHREAYHLNTDRLYMVGDSAGAHLVACYVNLLTNTDYARLFDFKPADLCPKAVGLNCGVFSAEELFKEDSMSSLFMTEACAQPLDPMDRKRADVLNNITENFVPTYILTGSHDFLKSESPRLAAVLAEKNVDTVLHVFSRKGIKLSHVFHTNPTMKEAVEANKEELQFFDQHK